METNDLVVTESYAESNRDLKIEKRHDILHDDETGLSNPADGCHGLVWNGDVTTSHHHG